MSRTRSKPRLITDDFGVSQLYRRCYQCRHWKVQRVGEFYVRRRHPDTRRIMRWDPLCCECRRVAAREYHAGLSPDVILERSRRRWAKISADPEETVRRRADNREVQRRRRERTPEKVRDVWNRYYENLKADPVRYEAYLQTRRMQYRLRKEREGHTVTRKYSGAKGAFRPAFGNSADLSVDPLAFWLDELLARDRRERQEIAEIMRIDDRALWRIQHREHDHVTMHVADCLIWGYDRPVEIRAKTLEAKLIEWAQSLPGNGTRLLRYLDRAEKVAHLADRVIDSVEDLYPELDRE